MLKVKGNREIVKERQEINEKHEAAAAAMGLGWRIVGSSVLHRYPVVVREPPEWEKEMWDVQELIEERQREVMMIAHNGHFSSFLKSLELDGNDFRHRCSTHSR